MQFRVEPNPQQVSASKVAQVLDEDIAIQKRLADALGVDIAKAAAGKRVNICFPIRKAITTIY